LSGVADNADTAIEAFAEQRLPDLALLDIQKSRDIEMAWAVGRN